MTKWLFIFILHLVWNAGFPSFAVSTETLRVRVSVPYPEILKSIGGDKILAEGFGRRSGEEEPYLPSRIFSIAIPPDAEFASLSADCGQKKTVPGKYQVRAVGPRSAPSAPLASDGKVVEFIRESHYREYKLVDVRVSPFHWEPMTQRLFYFPEIDIFIRTHRACSLATLVHSPSLRIRSLAQSIILNFGQAQAWYKSSNKFFSEHYDFVVITLDDLASAVLPLVEWEKQKGRTVRVVSTSWISSNYPGFDLAEKIRNFLRAKFPDDKWGIEDTLIVGHPRDIPMRRVWQHKPKAKPPETDFYYAELSLPDNQSWDSNNNRLYGENSDCPDFYSEINVGRIPWSERDIVRRICEKSVVFEKNTDPSYKNSILLLAAFTDPKTDGAKFAEYTVDVKHHPWMDKWTKTKLYEENSLFPSDLPISRPNILSAWTKGKFAVVSWHSHGSPTGISVKREEVFGVQDCDLLDDSYPAIISAAACSNSDTDYLNIGQALIKRGAVGFLGANKSAYYCSEWEDPKDGSDQSFKYFFLRSLTSGECTQGMSLQKALREMYQYGLWGDVGFETYVHSSLLGNPDLGLKPPRPSSH